MIIISDEDSSHYIASMDIGIDNLAYTVYDKDADEFIVVLTKGYALKASMQLKIFQSRAW